MRWWDKFCLLMWKNWKVQLRKPISFVVEIGIPLLVVGAFLLLRYYVEKTNVTGQNFVPLDVNLEIYDSNFPRAYSPNTSTFLNTLMSTYSAEIQGKANASELESFLLDELQDNDSNRVWIGIQFDDDFPSDSVDISGNITITLRYAGTWYTESVFPAFEVDYGYRGETSQSGGPPNYYAKMFTTLMFQLTRDICTQAAIETDLPEKIYLQRFPYPTHDEDQLIELASQGFLFSVLFMTAFLYACISIVKSITLEKEKQLKESMKIMGLPTWLHWTAWFFQIFIPFSVVGVFMTIGMKIEMRYGNIFTYTDWSVIFIFFIVYIIGLITFSFALSVFFSNANRAASLSGIIWVLTSLPYMIIRSNNNYASIGATTKYFSSLLTTTGMSYGFDLMSLYESRRIGIRWNNLFETSVENNITFGGILVMMVVDIFIYLAIALYVEQVFPGEFGVPQKWYFLFTKEFWFAAENFEGKSYEFSSKGEFFEEEPSNLQAGIQIKKLGKTFGLNDAVKELSLNLYQDQITVLLGHNGAGKTTTMSMLTGMFPPTKGTATINGYDIRTEIMKVRDSMGLCPQHNVLFDELTVREHLQFFCKLKGVKGADVDKEVQSFLELLSLEDKADEKSGALSGGMKRKLCVGIAICGDSKVIMLDEPTAGMDPSARRFIWEFLQKQKKGRTILLTTHFMDEADLLGDRIAIMSNGELKCCGSSFFLKKKYGTGYHLIIEQLPTCQPKKITYMLRNYIPYINIDSNAGTELTYLLPEEYAANFPEVLSQIENNMETFGIRSFGISLTDLEEVFMKVGTNETGRKIEKENGTHTNGHTNVTMSSSTTLETGIRLYINQVHAMASKKFLSVMRSWIMELFKTALPVLYIIMIVSIGNSHLATTLQDVRSFSLDDYDEPITLIQSSTSTFADSYRGFIEDQGQTYENTTSMSDTILDLMVNDPLTIKYRYIVGASFVDDSTPPTAWFNNEPYHSVPLSLQLMLNSYLKDQNLQINFVNYPLPDEKTVTELAVGTLIMSTSNLLCLSLAASYIGNFYILFNIKERVSQSKHLQFVSGINVFIFWFVSFIADFVTFVVPIVSIIITFAILQPDGLATATEISVMSLLFFCFAVAVLPFMYAFSYLFTVPSTGYSRLFFLGFAGGFPAVMIIYILNLTDWSYVDLTAWILRFIPHYDFIEGVQHLSSRSTCEAVYTTCGKNVTSADCKIKICNSNPSLSCCSLGEIFAFDDNGVSIQLVMILVVAILTFAILFLADLRAFTYLKYRLFANKQPPYVRSLVDEDVLNEDHYVHATPLHQLQSQYVLVLKDLMKIYKDLVAVNGLNLTVKRSECFGLLGVNGAGKTTTFKMMTGDETISYGDGWISGNSIRSDVKKVHKLIGYCPQFDALLDNLTARETLKIFSLIRGVPKDECAYTAEKLAREFDFTQHLDKQVKELSGGNKRKLSTSIALIGDAPVIFLDEPTTGMDPATKRHLWNQLARIRASGKSIILTSHSMEECEALCTRLVIMVNGNFQCLGSTQHLKSKFAEGFSVTLKIRKLKNSSGFAHADTTSIERFMANQFPESELREKHQELLNYYIKDKRVKWSRLFAILEEAKKELDIEDYSVGQASLEQVFLTFTKQQAPEREKKKRKKFLCIKCCT